MSNRERIQGLIFFVLFYLYLWLEVDLRLVYHGGPMVVNFPAFFKGGEFFRPYLSYPAGVLEYLSAFLSQLFHYSWAGALVVTLQAWLLSVCTAAFLKAVNAFTLRGTRFIGPILMLMLYAGYRYHFNITMMVLGAVVLACVYVKLRPESGGAVVLLFIALHVVAYAVTAGAHLLFVALCGIYELRSGRRWRIALLYPASAVVMPCVVGCLLYGVVPADAIGYSLFAPLEFHVCSRFPGTMVRLSLLYLFLPLTALALRPRRKETGGESAASPGTARRCAGYAAPFVLGAVVILLFRNTDIKAELAVHYHAYHRMWPEVLEIADDIEDNRDPGIVHTVNRALYHTGRLDRDMFRYRQHPNLLLLTDERMPEMYVSWHRFDTLIDLGQINLAEYRLNECTGFFGPRPVILRRLALIHMVKGDAPTARVYLNALAGTLFDADWAREYLDLLKADPDLSTDRRIQDLRALMVEKDRPVIPSRNDERHGFYATERMLLDLLEKNPANRMAFEYLMTLYLLNKRLDKFGGQLGRMKPLGYSRMPRLYEEAVLARSLVEQTRPESDPFEVSAESRMRANTFLWTYNSFRNDPNPKHFEEYRDSYLYYFFCVGPTPSRR